MHEDKSGPTRSTSQKIGLILGPALFLIVILFFDFDPEKPIVTRMAAVAILMAVWWITDATFCHGAAADASLSAVGNFKGQIRRTHLYQQHHFSVHGRIHDRANHGKVAVAPPHRTFHHPSHRGRAFTNYSRIHGGGRIFIHVDFQHRHCDYDGSHRSGNCFADGSQIR